MEHGTRIRVHIGARDAERFPAGDDDLGQSLFGMLVDALERGLPRPAMLVLRADQVDQYDLLPALQEPHHENLLGAMAGQDGVEAAALLGVLRTRSRPLQPDGTPREGLVAVCYLEWPDNRWWIAWQGLHPDHKVPLGEHQVRKATDGWPRPGNLGGWFALARRRRLKLTMHPAEDAVVH